MSSPEYFAAYQATNRVHLRALARKNYLDNRQARIHAACTRKFLKRIAHPFMKASSRTSVYQSRILKADPCAYCGGPSTGVDHIVPKIAWGVDDFTNVTAACSKCNRAKWKTPLLHFLLEKVGE